MPRIKVNCLVSTEAWQFDAAKSLECDRWSYKIFGEKWRDARVHGKVVGKCREKWKVCWDIDGTESCLESGKLCLELKSNTEKPIESDKDVTSRTFSDDSTYSDLDVTDSAGGSDADYEVEDLSGSSDTDFSRKPKQHEVNFSSSKSALLTEGEEVYLCDANIPVFKATFCKINTDQSVHGQTIGLNQARFFITKIMKDCCKWKNFDSDVHCIGAAILWNIAKIQRLIAAEVGELGTEARKPSVLSKRKRKRDPSKWIKNVKKLKLAGGERKYGAAIDDFDTASPLGNISFSCNCRMECYEKFTNEERKIINADFWSLNDITAQRLFITKFVTVKPKQRSRKRLTTKTGKRREKNMFANLLLLIQKVAI